MPASMMSDAVGESAKVIGRSMETVAVGPIPGSTPIRVPSSTPTKQKARLSGVSAVSKPSARLARRSISAGASSGPEPGAEQAQREPEPVAEDEDAEGGQPHG